MTETNLKKELSLTQPSSDKTGLLKKGSGSLAMALPACSEKVEHLPRLPGVYLFMGNHSEILYVGKARNLRKRVASYFRTAGSASAKIRALLTRTTDIDFVVTETEKEAFLLEASLIKKHRPRYNVIFRDDKNYPALRIDPREPYPRLEIVRRFQQDGALYFGPYASAHAVRATLKMLNRLFPLRQCRSKKLRPRQRPCLNYSLGRCLGACAGKVSRTEYQRIVQEVILFLQGKTDRLQRQLEQHMEAAAAKLDFEKAAFYRDRLRAVTMTLEQQHIVSSRFIDRDVVGIHTDTARTMLVVLFVRHGAIVGQRSFPFQARGEDTHEIIIAFMLQYYTEGRLIPDEILIPGELDEQPVLEELLTELRGKRVHIRPPKRGSGRILLELANRNAREQNQGRQQLVQKNQQLLEKLEEILDLPRFPRHMACVDISNLRGRHAVGSIVMFTDGQPDYGKYRRFSIKGKTEPDDPAMMAEVVERYIREHARLVNKLDLLVVDGGKGQLNRIRHVLDQEGLGAQVPIIALAKERLNERGKEGRGLYEKVYLPGRKKAFFLTKYPEILHLLQRLRDEAHRYAISFYQKRHRQELLASSVDAIPGIGLKRRHLLLKHFHSLDRLQRATIEELRAVPGISPKLAERIYQHFHEPISHSADH